MVRHREHRSWWLISVPEFIEDEVAALHKCVTCGADLHPERAAKYNYCMSAECQEKNARGLTMVAVGVNKAAEQYLILDEQTKADLASGKYRDQRRGSFGTSLPSSTDQRDTRPAAAAQPPSKLEPRRRRKAADRPVRRPAQRQPWSLRQQRLALLYNEQGLRPEEIARKLGMSPYLVTQIILTSRNRGKL
jgi:DNA-binding CsgD family transcriptional regulator